MSKREIRKPFVRRRAALADGINVFDKDKAELSPTPVYYFFGLCRPSGMGTG